MKKNIYLCDFRGTDNQDSTADLWLPYIAYQMSHIFVVNCTSIIDNQSINQLQSIATYANDISNELKDIEKKNKYLVFRIKDINMDVNDMEDY